jgi:hypothetical protein
VGFLHCGRTKGDVFATPKVFSGFASFRFAHDIPAIDLLQCFPVSRSLRAHDDLCQIVINFEDVDVYAKLTARILGFPWPFSR